MTETEQLVEAEEKRQLRPYRRLVVVLFSVVLATLGAFIFRGIVRHLDRLPTAESLDKPSVVDVRGLRACADDLERLELRVRERSARVFSRVLVASDDNKDAHAMVEELELERLKIVARCRLSEPTTDPVVHDLEHSASELELLIRAYALLFDRHLDEVLPHSQEAHRALERATTVLKTR